MWLFRLLALIALTTLALPLQAQTQKTLSGVLRLNELAQLLHQEGLTHGEVLDRDMLFGQGGTVWRQQAGRIYAASRISGTLARDLDERLSGALRSDIIAFFDTGEGQKILSSEFAARRLMADPDFERRAINDLSDRRHSADPTFAAVESFIRINDLVGYNMSGAMNANFQFLRSFAAQGGGAVPDGEILAEVQAGAEELEADITEWLQAYLLTAYGELDAGTLERYLDFCRSPAGQAYNRELFYSFDRLYRAISGDLGRAAARMLVTEEL